MIIVSADAVIESYELGGAALLGQHCRIVRY
jgi:hypothetical protein